MTETLYVGRCPVTTQTPQYMQQDFVSFKGGFFYCPDEAIYHRDRGNIIQEYGQIILKVTDQRRRRSAIRT